MPRPEEGKKIQTTIMKQSISKKRPIKGKKRGDKIRAALDY